MPFDTQPRERNIGTGRACRAIVAARLLDPAAELPAFRALQLARFTTTALFDTDEGIRAALARVPQARRDRARRDRRPGDRGGLPGRPRARAHRGRQPDRVPGQGREHRRRRPLHGAVAALRRTATARRLEAGGYQPVEAYDVVIANLDPTLDRRGARRGRREVLAAFPYALTTREVAAVMAPHLVAPDDGAAEALLIDAAAAGRVRRETVGGGALWHLVTG